MRKYKIEAGIESKTSLTTTKYYDNAQEVKEFIKGLDPAIWYVVEYAATNQRIVEHNYTSQGTIYNQHIKCPKALMNL